MKKSEMIHSLTHFLYENTGQFREGQVGLPLSICQTLAPLILAHLQKDGMEAPSISIPTKAIFFDREINVSNITTVRMWEPEDEEA